MIDSLASKLDIRLKSGYNDALRSCRLTLDPMVTYHRPLVIYVTIYVLTKIFHYVLQMWGMTRYSPEMPSSLAIFRDSPSSWQTKLQGKQPEKITYWFRDGDRLNKRPIVFIHGLGAGLMCYAGFLRTLLDLEAPIFCIELPHVAMRFTEDAPSAEDTVRDIERMLHRHDFQDAVFIAHSLGTAVTAWALKLIPKCISGVIMLDSICFMLHYKDVCGNFVYRMPTTASQFIIKYFASSELYISYYISRHFHWFKAALYVTPPECNDPSMTWMTTRLPANTKIYLSEKDSIVNSPLVASYLQGRKVECEVMKGLEHATFLFQPYWKQRIVETLEKFILVN
ncbi:Alpha/Beta hydrolase protein [Spinellus fusiger]|nr:Alpha/Beta hydrolase protein [Spinellus fusiger]